jgi:hypothetical protein
MLIPHCPKLRLLLQVATNLEWLDGHTPWRYEKGFGGSKTDKKGERKAMTFQRASLGKSAERCARHSL